MIVSLLGMTQKRDLKGRTTDQRTTTCAHQVSTLERNKTLYE